MPIKFLFRQVSHFLLIGKIFHYVGKAWGYVITKCIQWYFHPAIS
jgi:hypothetical protein